MPPRLQLFRSGQACISRPLLPQTNRRQVPLCLRLAQQRSITADEKPLPKAEQQEPGPNQEQLPHVSEEAAMTGKITGEGGPDIEHGTPVQEVCRTCEALEGAY
jgi:small subunit ribosomal protein S7